MLEIGFQPTTAKSLLSISLLLALLCFFGGVW